MAITRLPKPVPDDLPPARLYLDDIEEVATILAAALEETTAVTKQGEKATDIQTKFRIEDKVAPQIRDFEHLKKRTHDLTVIVSKGNFQAMLIITGSDTRWLSVDLSREKSWDTYSKLKTIFDQKNCGGEPPLTGNGPFRVSLDSESSFSWRLQESWPSSTGPTMAKLNFRRWCYPSA
jgi:hypothetical protein